MTRRRVCIIGGGASGIACARVLASGEYPCEPTVFERNAFIGGQWHYDASGLSDSSAVYRDLRTNLPCSVMQFSDFPFPASEPDAYIGCQEMEDYLLAYVDKHQLRQYILLSTEIMSVDDTFTVTYRVQVDANDQDSSRPTRVLLKQTDGFAVYSEQFDAVCVANGHYSEPSRANRYSRFSQLNISHHSLPSLPRARSLSRSMRCRRRR